MQQCKASSLSNLSGLAPTGTAFCGQMPVTLCLPDLQAKPKECQPKCLGRCCLSLALLCETLLYSLLAEGLDVKQPNLDKLRDNSTLYLNDP